MGQTTAPSAARLSAEVIRATFLFTDIEGSTQLARRLGQASWMEVMSAHNRIVGDSIREFGGRVDHTEGDAFVAVFTDAAAAVRAAVEAQRRLDAYAWPEAAGAVRVRMGVHTGTVVAHTTGYVGLDAHLAARVASAANGGQILITRATLRAAGGGIAVRDLGPHRLKDFPEPERLYHVMVQTVDEGPVPSPRTASVRPTNLPPETRALVGRERERESLRELLRDEPSVVVTIAGIGGSGKTRLAVAVGRELLDDFPGGVFLVRLAGVGDVESIVPMIAEVLGLSRAEAGLVHALAHRLGGEPTLLILDNFEQLVAGATVVAELVQRAPALRILVTSQVSLRVAAERVVPLGALAPEEAVALFEERARALVADFTPSDEDRAAIERICARLDYMPLAIELAAARIGLFEPRSLEQRLERPLALLTRGDRDAPERQRSLRATIEWTHSLLAPGAQALLARLAVCAGPVPLGAVEALSADGSIEAMDDLEQLLEFSFVRRREDRHLGLRFLVPQAVRDYALERLAEAGEEDGVRRLHAEHMAKVAHDVRLWKWGTTLEQRTALLALANEIRPAVAWARTSDPELHVALCAALAAYWVYRGVLAEVIEQFRRARESGLGSNADRAWILTLRAKCAQLEQDNETAAQLTGQMLSEWDSVKTPVERALGLQQVSWVFRWEFRYEQAIELAREALAVLRRTGDQNLTARGLVFLAHALVDWGNSEPAEAVLEEADKLVEGDPAWDLAPIHGDCALMKGDDAAALKLYAQSLSWSSATGESHQTMMDARAVVVCLARLGKAQQALEASELVALEEQRTGRVGDNPGWGPLGEAVTLVRQAADAETFERAAGLARAVPAACRAERILELAGAVADE